MEQVKVVWFVRFVNTENGMTDIEEFATFEQAWDWADPAKFTAPYKPLEVYAEVQCVSITKICTIEV